MKRRGPYRYLKATITRGKPYLYFRRRGYPTISLPNPIGGPEFLLAYMAALNEPPLPPASSLPGGIARQNPNAVKPLIGVYLLLLKGQIVYVGESLNMPR